MDATQRHNLSVSGSTDKSNYYVSLGFLEKKGWIDNDEYNIDFDRYNMLAKVSYEVTDWLEMDTRALVTHEENDEPHFYTGMLILTLLFGWVEEPLFPDLPII